MKYLSSGTFLQDITENATWAYVVDVNNGVGHTTGVLAFCDAMEDIEQPDPDRKQKCPPEKGFALISIHSFVPWFVGEVSRLLLPWAVQGIAS